ncbi:Epimerase domain-containing protein, partial [Psidium guajava]
MEGNKGTVCVTGGTGFIASWLIMRLLEHGYSVRTTVRPDPDGRRDISFLKNLPGASERLQILTADLENPESFSPAIQDCVGVFHAAALLDFKDKELEPVIAKKSIDGALGILRACLNSKTVKRVVYTSSTTAVQFNGSNVEDILDEDS